MSKKIFLACLSDENKQAIKEEIKTPQGLLGRVAKGIFIPIDEHGRLMSKENFVKLVYN